MPLAEGQVIAGYTIVRSLGSGGMGEVYLARHPRLPRFDALKVLSAAVCAESEYRERFNREADMAASLWHPHIVEVHDRGDVNGQLWISMDYVEGTDAGELLTRPENLNGLPPDDVVRIINAIADALDYAHERGLLHRDIKPTNILLADDGDRIMLADFGIARRMDDTSQLTSTNMTVGTVAYAAPEQLRGEHLDGRADQYALAATAFQLLTGTPPFQHSNPAVVISQHLTAAPPSIGARRPELSSLGPVFDKALAKSPADRYERCIDFARALAHRIATPEAAVGADMPTARAIPATGPRHAKVEKKSGRGRTVAKVAAAAVAVLAVVATGFFAFDRVRDRSADPATGDAQLPVVVIGAECSTLGAAGITEGGAPAYCAHLESANKAIWSKYPGKVSEPTLTLAPSDQSVPADLQGPVLVCMEQTGKSQLDCHNGIVSTTPAPSS